MKYTDGGHTRLDIFRYVSAESERERERDLVEVEVVERVILSSFSSFSFFSSFLPSSQPFPPILSVPCVTLCLDAIITDLIGYPYTVALYGIINPLFFNNLFLASLKVSRMCSPKSPESTSSVTIRSTLYGISLFSVFSTFLLFSFLLFFFSLFSLSSLSLLFPLFSPFPLFLPIIKSLLCFDIIVILLENISPYSEIHFLATSARS